MEVRLTDVQRRALEALAGSGPLGPGALSHRLWPDNISVGKGNAPGTGLVRSALAVLARLRRSELVFWFAPRSSATRGQRKGGRDPVVWMLSLKGAASIGDESTETRAAIMRSMDDAR